MPQVHFTPEGSFEIVFAGEDAKTANAARTKTVPTNEMTVKFFLIFIPPARLSLSWKVDANGVSGVSRSGKFPSGPKGVLMDDDRVDVGNLHDSPLNDSGFGRRGLGRWDGGRENRKEVEGDKQIDCINDILYILPRE